MDAATVFLHLALPLRYGFFSDVHGDLEGLERALEALSEVDRLVFLGDVLGGRRDRECLERLQSISELIWVPGNHDLWEFESMGLSPTAQTALRCLPLEQPVEGTFSLRRWPHHLGPQGSRSQRPGGEAGCQAAGVFTVAQLRDLGVRRISLGGALARAAWGGVMRAATEILESGTFEELGQAPSMSEMSKFLKA